MHNQYLCGIKPWWNLKKLKTYLKRNCLLRLDGSIVSISTTWMRRNPDKAWSKERLCKNLFKPLKRLCICSIYTWWWTLTKRAFKLAISYQIFQQLTTKSSCSDHQNLACFQQKMQGLVWKKYYIFKEWYLRLCSYSLILFGLFSQIYEACT